MHFPKVNIILQLVSKLIHYNVSVQYVNLYTMETPQILFKKKISSQVGVCGGSSWCNGQSDGLRDHSKRVCTPVVLLHSLLDKYPWERYETSYPPSYGLNSTTTVLLEEWLWH